MTTFFNIDNESQLAAVILSLNGHTDDNVIFVNQDFSLSTRVTPIALGDGGTLTIQGANHTINGQDAFQAFFVTSGNVVFNNINVTHARSLGGTGGTGVGRDGGGGGGGAGLGGAIFVSTGARVTVSGGSFTLNAAIGGNGGYPGQYNGAVASGGGGGGALGLGGTGATNGGNAVLNGGLVTGGRGGGFVNPGTTAGFGQGGAGAGSPSPAAGIGGYGGGGGGRGTGGVGRNGGFGGGGAGGSPNSGSGYGLGGYGGGSGLGFGRGGGGMGAGGAIFVQSGGYLTVSSPLNGAQTAISGNSVIAGYGASVESLGKALGKGIFTNGVLFLGPVAGGQLVVADDIAGNGLLGIQNNTTLSGTNTHKAGMLLLGGADVTLATAASAGTGNIAFLQGATLTVGGSIVPSNTLASIGVSNTIHLTGVHTTGLSQSNASSGHIDIPLNTGGSATLRTAASGTWFALPGVANETVITGGGTAQAAVTVRGATARNGRPSEDRIFAIPFDTPTRAAVAQAVIDPVNVQVLLGNVSLTPVVSDELRSSGFSGANTAMAVATSSPITVSGGATNGQLILAGNGGLAFNALGGAGSVIAGGGNNLMSAYPGAGTQTFLAGNGNDTLIALASSATLDAGSGSNLLLTGNGSTLIDSRGSDLIASTSTGPGSATIRAHANNPTIFLGAGADDVRTDTGSATIVGGTGVSTVTGGLGADLIFAGTGRLNVAMGGGSATLLGNPAGSASLRGGTGSLVAIAHGSTTFTGGGGSATIGAFGGSLTAVGGTGNSVLLGGPVGGNRLTGGSGQSIMIAGGDGDVLTAGSGAGDVLQSGAGSATLRAVGTTGAHLFYGGAGATRFELGSGQSQVLLGTGDATIVAGTGIELFAFTSGRHPSVTIQGFNPALHYLSLPDFAPGGASFAVSSAVTFGSSQLVSLPDGTLITFEGFHALTTASFL